MKGFEGPLAVSGTTRPVLPVASGQREPAWQWDKPVGVFIAAPNLDPPFFFFFLPLYMCTE